MGFAERSRRPLRGRTLVRVLVAAVLSAALLPLAFAPARINGRPGFAAGRRAVAAVPEAAVEAVDEASVEAVNETAEAADEAVAFVWPTNLLDAVAEGMIDLDDVAARIAGPPPGGFCPAEVDREVEDILRGAIGCSEVKLELEGSVAKGTAVSNGISDFDYSVITTPALTKRDRKALAKALGNLSAVRRVQPRAKTITATLVDGSVVDFFLHNTSSTEPDSMAYPRFMGAESRAEADAATAAFFKATPVAQRVVRLLKWMFAGRRLPSFLLEHLVRRVTVACGGEAWQIPELMEAVLAEVRAGAQSEHWQVLLEDARLAAEMLGTTTYGADCLQRIEEAMKWMARKADAGYQRDWFDLKKYSGGFKRIPIDDICGSDF